MRAKECHLVASAIVSELERAERSVEWLAGRTDIDPDVLVAKLAHREDLTVVDLAKIAAALDIPVAALAPSPRPPGR